MFEKVKSKLANIKEENQRKNEERERIAREQAEEEARLERERIQAEKDALMTLSEKELIVEMVMALRGYNTRITQIEEWQEDSDDRLDFLESHVSSLETDLSDLKSNTDY